MNSNDADIVKKQRPLGEVLMEMAGYGQISATSCIVTSSDRTTIPVDIDYNTVTMNSFRLEKYAYLNKKNTRDVETDRQIYVPFYVNNHRVVGLMDSGSDITIMHASLYKRIFQTKLDLAESDISHVVSFNGGKIPLLGKQTIHLGYSKKCLGLKIDLYIIEDIPQVPIFLVGFNVFKAGLIMLTFSGNIDDPYPEVIFKFPAIFHSPVFYESPRKLNICTAYNITLGPYEVKSVRFELSSSAPVIRTDIILITSAEWDTVTIIPTRTNLELISPNQNYCAEALVANTSGKILTNITVESRYELINEFRSVEVSNENKGRLTRALATHPFGREILTTKSSANIELPLVTVHHLASASGNELLVSDLDYADTIMGKEPTFCGMAEISPEIIEPSGLDLPTLIHATAADAIDLSSYSEEIRPFIEKIFIQKYPEVVSLHSLDAGNLSLTLGYTQLRLREGELLPRAKRIFHISPSDQRHLDDICELLIKFGYIMRSPMTPDGSHLYGMSAYLVPRSKPNCLGRLIVDFSPVNQLIQSPSSVIPEIGATLQFLRGKALYSSLDLRYAYLALRIDEESRKLTTFLTPSGSYRWLALPTGAALSPAYFTDACNRILHFSPEYDSSGKLIYEARNVVKQKRDPLKFVCNYFDDILATSPLKPTYGETLTCHFEILEQCVQRLAFHGAKINVMKCEFARSKILFLGWYVSHDYVIADPRRIQKIREFKFPDNKKSVRAFLGLVNSLRKVVAMNVIEHVAILTPLTSSKVIFAPEEKHYIAFEKIKHLLISEPLFGHLIDESAEKFLWVDAATTSGVLGGVLAQKIVGTGDEKVVPTFLDLDDKVHRLIFDKELLYEPCRLYTSLPIELPKPTSIRTVPPRITPLGDLLGFTEDNVHESFFWSTISTLPFA